MNEDPAHKEQAPQQNGRWSAAVTLVVMISAIFIISGITIFAFVSFFDVDQPEEDPLFPFEREYEIPYTNTEEPRYMIEEALSEIGEHDRPVEILFRQRFGTVSPEEIMRRGEVSLPRSATEALERSVVGVYNGSPFFILHFTDDAYPLITPNEEGVMTSVEYLTGHTWNMGNRENLKRENTLVVSSNETVYGFLDDRTVAVTSNEEILLEILDRYRTFHR